MSRGGNVSKKKHPPLAEVEAFVVERKSVRTVEVGDRFGFCQEIALRWLRELDRAGSVHRMGHGKTARWLAPGEELDPTSPEKIRKYIKQNPYKSTADIADHFNLHDSTMSNRLSRLLKAGEIVSQTVDGNRKAWRVVGAPPKPELTTQQVYDVIRENPNITRSGLAAELNVWHTTLTHHLNALKDQCRITYERVGREKYWRADDASRTETKSWGSKFHMPTRVNPMITRAWK